MLAEDDTQWWHEQVEYDARSGTYRASYEGHPIGTVVVELVGLATDTDPIDLPAIWEVVDPEAVETVFGPQSASDGVPNAQLSFEYGDCRITVRDDRTVVVQPLAR